MKGNNSKQIIDIKGHSRVYMGDFNVEGTVFTLDGNVTVNRNEEVEKDQKSDKISVVGLIKKIFKP